MSANFVQVSGPGGRTQTLAASASTQTFLWNPSSLKGQLDGGDFIYAKRIKLRTLIPLVNTSGTGPGFLNWQQSQQLLGQVRVFSQFLGEMVPKSMNSAALLGNHDAYFNNGAKPITRKRPSSSITTAQTTTLELITEIPFEREYLQRSQDSCPWLPFLEGGQIECDLAPLGVLSGAYGWNMTGNITQTCTIDTYVDKQPLIHAPVQSRIYRVTSPGPEFTLRVVGGANGLDGVISGSRIAYLSWLFSGGSDAGLSPTGHDNGFYQAFGGGGILPGTAGINRFDVPFRSQVSIDDVNAWLESFLSDVGPTRFHPNINVETNANDLADWPFMMNATQAALFYFAKTSLVNDALDFWPLIWPGMPDRISDFQKVNGDLTFTVTFGGTPPGNVLNLFRTDEVCGFTPQKIYDIMNRMGLPHVDQGGQFTVIPKYAGAKRADPTTVFGFPLKIIKAK